MNCQRALETKLHVVKLHNILLHGGKSHHDTVAMIRYLKITEIFKYLLSCYNHYNNYIV